MRTGLLALRNPTLAMEDTIRQPKSGKDEVFTSEQSGRRDFKFNSQVVKVFDDMVTRSVPFYIEIQRMMTELAKDIVPEHGVVYDLGCSTGTTFLNLDAVLPESVKFVGIDNSQAMLDQCRDNLREAGVTREVELRYGDLDTGVEMPDASLVVLCLTLQFVRPLYRERLVQSVYDQLNDNGAVFLIEKVLGESSMFNRLFIDYYYDFKRRNDYSDMEIAQKRESLENVLIPYKLEENRELLRQVGFRFVDVFFKWYNFTGVVAVK